MHTFQPYPIDKMEFNPFTKIGKEWALVSAGDKTRCNTMTVSWGGVGVLWGKNVVFIFIRDSRYTKEFLYGCLCLHHRMHLQRKASYRRALSLRYP